MKTMFWHNDMMNDRYSGQMNVLHVSLFYAIKKVAESACRKHFLGRTEILQSRGDPVTNDAAP